MPIRTGTRRDRLIRLPSVVAEATFAGTDGTALETADTKWTKHANSGAGSATIDAGRVHNTNDATSHLYYHAWAPASPDYAVGVDIVMRSDNDLSHAGPALRIDTAANTAYFLRYFTNGNIWQIVKIVAGVQTGLASSVVQVLVVDRAYRAVLRAVGAQLTAFVDGAAIISTTDAAITAAGRAGVRLQDAATATVGVHLDNFRVTQ